MRPTAGALALPEAGVGLERVAPFAAITLAAVALRLGIYAWMARPYGGLVDAMCHFDCGWYERLALAGYGADAQWADFGSYPHWAFFPLYPLGVFLLHRLIDSSALAAGILLSSLAFAVFVVVGAWYLRETRAAVKPAIWLIVVLLFPYGFFFSAVYTEALFALLAAGALLALRRRRVLLAAGLAALASATRPTGILLSPILLADRLAALWRGRHRLDRAALLGETVLPVAVAPLGLFLYMLVQYTRIGDALAFSHVQVLWHRQWGDPFGRIWAGLRSWDFLALPASPSSAYAAAFALLGLAAAIGLALRRRGAEAGFLAGCILLPAASGLDSLPRFVATNPVFLFAAYDIAARLTGRRAHPGRRAILAIFLAGLQATLLLAWFGGAGGVF